MTILITGASGQLGRLVVHELLRRGVAPEEIVAGTRAPAALHDLAERGVRPVELDFTEPATIAGAIEGVDAVLLISGSEPGNRVRGHLNVIEAARAAGVSKLVYTSAPKATTSDHPLAPDHRATEEAIAASGVPAVILRNGWYTENYLADVLRAADSGVIAAAVGDATVSSASRRDYAEAAAAVLVEDGHLGRVYELGGDEAWTYDELAAAASEVLGRDVAYVRLTPDQLSAALVESGLDAGTAGFVVALDTAIAAGVLTEPGRELSRLLGRPTTPLVEGLREAVALRRAPE